MKQCYVCKQWKPMDEFSGNVSRADGKQTYCRACGKDKQTQWYYQRKHKITLEERDALLVSQGGRCAICDREVVFNQKGRSNNTGEEAVIDHCHTSKKIRGVLCGFCNTGLGSFKDDIDNLERAIIYLLQSGEK